MIKFILGVLFILNIAHSDVYMSNEIFTSELQNRVLRRLGQLESSNNYEAVNRLKYVGKYQFGAARLEDLNYIKKGCYSKYKNGATFRQSCLTKKSKFDDVEKFLTTPKLQEKVAKESLSLSYQYLLNKKFIPKTKGHLAGYLMAAHLSGDRGAYEYITKNIIRRDANGTKTIEYYLEVLKLYK